jgi:uncharacterized DUF497 family protein
MKVLPEPIICEWDKWNIDKIKNKHGLSPQECEGVLFADLFILLTDTIHSTVEDRYFVIGPNQETMMLTLIITVRGEHVRIISARPSSKKERKIYEETFKAT